MDLLQQLLKDAGGGATSQIAKQFGLDDSQAGNILGQLVPALTAGLKKNTGSTGGVEGLAKALQKGGHQRYIDEPETLGDSGAVNDGNNILGHLLGSKDVSRQVAAAASSNTGIDAGIVKKMLPLVATMVMGSLSKQTGGGAKLADDGPGLLGALFGGDSNAGDLLGLAAKFLK